MPERVVFACAFVIAAALDWVGAELVFGRGGASQIALAVIVASGLQLWSRRCP